MHYHISEGEGGREGCELKSGISDSKTESCSWNEVPSIWFGGCLFVLGKLRA